MPESVAGWFPDPSGRFEARFWDGGQWTGAVMTNGEVKSDSGTDPAASPPLSVSAATGGGGGAVVPPSPTPGRNERTTTLPPAEAQVRLVQALSMHGARIEMSGQGQIRATVDIKGKVSIPLLGILLFFFVVPAIVYWVYAERPQPHSVTFTIAACPQGSWVTASGDRPMQATIATVLAQLPW